MQTNYLKYLDHVEQGNRDDNMVSGDDGEKIEKIEKIEKNETIEKIEKTIIANDSNKIPPIPYEYLLLDTSDDDYAPLRLSVEPDWQPGARPRRSQMFKKQLKIDQEIGEENQEKMDEINEDGKKIVKKTPKGKKSRLSIDPLKSNITQRNEFVFKSMEDMNLIQNGVNVLKKRKRCESKNKNGENKNGENKNGENKNGENKNGEKSNEEKDALEEKEAEGLYEKYHYYFLGRPPTLSSKSSLFPRKRVNNNIDSTIDLASQIDNDDDDDNFDSKNDFKNQKK